MSTVSPVIVDRIVADLSRKGGVRSTSDLARQFLGLGILDERVAGRLLDPVLEADPRLVRDPSGCGWMVAPDAGALSSAELSRPHLIVLAPRNAGGAWADACVGQGDPAYTLALEGPSEARAYETLSGRRCPGPVLSLAGIARRLRGYRGAADPVRIAEHLGAPHLDMEGLEGWLAATGACWEHLCAELETESVTDVEGLERLLDARLEAADFAGTRLSPARLDELSEGPGVYTFEDRSGRPLYVGQSAQLRSRVCSYFAGPPRDEKDRQIRGEAFDLHVVETDTGLDAWIEEQRRIRRLAPRLNTRRQVLGTPGDDGVLVVPDPLSSGRAVLYGIWNGRLAARAVAGPGARRVVSAIDRVFDSGGRLARRGDAGEAASLAAAWQRLHPTHRLFQPGLDGTSEQVCSALEHHLRAL